jgi:hypothetical protein
VSTLQPPIFALSVKQPWAALVVHGLKTIEVRRWQTARRGPILIHAARVPDDRPEGWDLVTTDELHELAQLRGGLIGSVNLIECVTYRDLPSFAKDQSAHRNHLSWFEPPKLYGFRFAAPKVTPFRVYPGWFRFFTVKDITPIRAASAVAIP